MSDISEIEWLLGKDGSKGSTWNPIRARNLETGAIGWHCEHCSAGCTNCYAEQINKGFFQLGTTLPYIPLAKTKIEIFLDEKTLEQPLHWKKGRKIFPCSMTDWAGCWVSDEWMDKLLAVAALCPQHTFLFLTKRTSRLPEYFSCWSDELRQEMVGEAAYKLNETLFSGAEDCKGDCTYLEWPLPNVMLGFSAEDQKNFDERWEDMSALAAWGWKVWCSAEPLLGPIDAYSALHYSVACANCGDGQGYEGMRCSCGEEGYYSQQPQLDWLVVGGESGPHARPMHPDWVRSLRDQCDADGVSFFFKQWGAYGLYDDLIDSHRKRANETICVFPDGSVQSNAQAFSMYADKPWWMLRLGKKAAGRLLDGREWNEFPEL